MSLLNDPVLVTMAAMALGVILVNGASQKWREREMFKAIVENYGLLPLDVVAVAALAVTAAETVVGIALLLPTSRQAAAVGALLLLAVVTLAVVINLLRGREDISCGCGGASGDQRLSWSLVLRNLALGAGALLAASAPTARSWLWLDFVTAGAGALAIVGIYAAVNQLLTNQPRLLALRP